MCLTWLFKLRISTLEIEPMWRRTYLVLLLVRIFLALSPSYLHPDEHFQGPEVFAGRIYSYPSQLTWEFTSDRPIRSVFPLWFVYGIPMSLVRWFYEEAGYGSPPPALVYYVLRLGMLVLSFVLEDWAIHELVSTPSHRVQTTVLVASSYVTWTYQTHTFSNAVETLLVAWGLVLIGRIIHNKKHSASLSCLVLSFVVVTGIFNRITFPAFLLIPGLQLIPHFLRKPFSLLCFAVPSIFFTAIAVLTDTAFYQPTYSFLQSIRQPIITPLNSLFYNADPENLATHGLHPHYQHFLVNLPQLLGPVYVVLIISLFSQVRLSSHLANKRAISAISGTMILSIFPHQEPRFLIPCVPLLLTCVRVPKSRTFLAIWIIFNAILGFLFGVYHQGGVVPTQLEIPSLVSANMSQKVDRSVIAEVASTANVYWWKTYSPPLWLLGDNSTLPIEIHTHDLMGMPGSRMLEELEASVPRCDDPVKGTQARNQVNATFLVAPRSAVFLDPYRRHPSSTAHDPSGLRNLPINLHELWTYSKHLNLDDLDFGEDGIFPTLKRVIGRHGLTVWEVRRPGCIS